MSVGRKLPTDMVFVFARYTDRQCPQPLMLICKVPAP